MKNYVVVMDELPVRVVFDYSRNSTGTLGEAPGQDAEGATLHT
jgi:hypothetical protein